MPSFIKRFAEPSTWAGLSPLFLLAGFAAPEAQAIAQAGAAIAALIAVFVPEKSGKAAS